MSSTSLEQVWIIRDRSSELNDRSLTNDDRLKKRWELLLLKEEELFLSDIVSFIASKIESKVVSKEQEDDDTEEEIGIMGDDRDIVAAEDVDSDRGGVGLIPTDSLL